MISRLIAFLFLLIFSPLLIIISISIIIDDRTPILFTQKRIGLNNCKFLIYKFRTMKVGTPDIATHLLKGHKHKYTFIGSFLRKSSLDELPQLINIIKGDMLFIGPRPALHNQDHLINLRMKYDVHLIKPGITGWAQVNGRDYLNTKDKVKMDTYYLKNKSFFLKIKILIFTFIKVIRVSDISS